MNNYRALDIAMRIAREQTKGLTASIKRLALADNKELIKDGLEMTQAKYLSILLESAKSKQADLQSKVKVVKKELDRLTYEVVDINEIIRDLSDKLHIEKSRSIVEEMTQREVDIARAYGHEFKAGQIMTEDIKNILRGK